MKPKPNRLGMYADLRPILDAALLHGGGTYECADHGQAVHWRQRAYQFRKLFAELYGLREFSIYDKIIMPRVPPESSTVTIRIREAAGTFTPAGDPIAEPLMGDDLFDEAAALAARLEKGEP